MLKKRAGSLKIRIAMLVLALIGVLWTMKTMKDSNPSSTFLDVMMSSQGSPASRPGRIITQPAELPEEPAKSDTSVDKNR